MSEAQPPVTVDLSALTMPLLAERLLHEREMREQAERFIAEDFAEFKVEIQRRLAELNHAGQLAVEAQARTVPRELFDAHVKENEQRREQSFAALGTRLEQSIDNVRQTHRVAIDAVNGKLDTFQTSLSGEIEIERNARIRSEGSVAVWRFIAVFLGFPGIVALLLAVIALFGPVK